MERRVRPDRGLANQAAKTLEDEKTRLKRLRRMPDNPALKELLGTAVSSQPSETIGCCRIPLRYQRSRAG